LGIMQEKIQLIIGIMKQKMKREDDDDDICPFFANTSRIPFSVFLFHWVFRVYFLVERLFLCTFWKIFCGCGWVWDQWWCSWVFLEVIYRNLVELSRVLKAIVSFLTDSYGEVHSWHQMQILVKTVLHWT